MLFGSLCDQFMKFERTGVVDGPDSKGNYFVRDLDNDELYMFDNVRERNPYRGIGSMCVKHAFTRDLHRPLWWILGVFHNTTNLDDVGPILAVGTKVSYCAYSVDEVLCDEWSVPMVQRVSSDNIDTLKLDVEFEKNGYAGLAFGIQELKDSPFAQEKKE